MNAPSTIAHALSAEAAAARAILESIAETIAGDDEAPSIVIESETQLVEVMAAAVDREAELKALSTAIAERIKDLSARKSRMEEGVRRIRGALRSALYAVPNRKMELPQATISIRAVAKGLEIVDPEAIPTTYLKQPPPVVDKAALIEDLRLGVYVAGAKLVESPDTISIKRT